MKEKCIEDFIRIVFGGIKVAYPFEFERDGDLQMDDLVDYANNDI